MGSGGAAAQGSGLIELQSERAGQLELGWITGARCERKR
jgi:hypothetical protein